MQYKHMIKIKAKTSKNMKDSKQIFVEINFHIVTLAMGYCNYYLEVFVSFNPYTTQLFHVYEKKMFIYALFKHTSHCHIPEVKV